MYRKIDVMPIEPIFLRCKSSITEDNVAELYTSIDSIIDRITKNISKTYRRKHAEEFEDLQQSIKLEIFKVMPRLVGISIDAEQFVRLLVSSILYKFKQEYSILKKKQPIEFYETHPSDNGWKPDNDVLIIHYLDLDKEEETSPSEGSIAPSQEYYVYLSGLKDRLLSLAKDYNRFKDKEEIILFCIDYILKGQTLSRRLLKKMYNINNIAFWIRYSEVLLRLVCLKVFEEDRVNFI